MLCHVEYDEATPRGPNAYERHAHPTDSDVSFGELVENTVEEGHLNGKGLAAEPSYSGLDDNSFDCQRRRDILCRSPSSILRRFTIAATILLSQAS
jgi:hypothetical protein